MNKHLEEAAALLRKAADANEKTTTHLGSKRTDDEINEGRERIAMKMATLGAIEAGVIPAALLRELLDRLPEVRQDAP